MQLLEKMAQFRCQRQMLTEGLIQLMGVHDLEYLYGGSGTLIPNNIFHKRLA